MTIEGIPRGYRDHESMPQHQAAHLFSASIADQGRVGRSREDV